MTDREKIENDTDASKGTVPDQPSVGARSDENRDSPQKPVGLLARFDGPEPLLAVAARLRDEGFRRWDAMSPFPIHGMERAMGIRPTRLPWLVLAAGIAGAVAVLGLQWWTNAVDYPMRISGKPMFSLPADIPVIFELIILFSALAAFFGAARLESLAAVLASGLRRSEVCPRDHRRILRIC